MLSLRWWLGGLVIAVALPVLILLIIISVSQVEREQAEARMTAYRIARAGAGRIQDSYAESLALVAQMARRPGVMRSDPRECHAVFSAIDFFPRYADILLFDRNGRLVCAGNTEAENEALSRRARAWIAEALQRRRLRTDAPTVVRFENQPMAILASRVDASGGTIALLEFVEKIGQNAIFPGAVMTILDHNGTVIARSPSSDEWIGRSVAGTRIGEVAARLPEGVAEVKGLDGVARQYGFARIPQFGWAVYVGVPNSAITEPVREMLLNGAIGGIGIVIVVAVMTLAVANRIGKPINALVAASTTADEGSYARVANQRGPLELATLAGAFNRMVDRRQDTDRRMRIGERKLKALHERLLAVQEEERRRIARELHDDLGQSLTALKMDCIGLLQKMERTPAIEAIGTRILRTLDTTVSAVQRISSELRPSVLDDLGLVAAIEEEARLFEARSGIECALRVEGEMPDDSETVTTVYRIVQEALTNVARHSNATRTELLLRQQRDELLLEIRDDGRGVTPEEIGDPHSLGLIGIRERAALIGGTVQIEGVDGEGTTVLARIPIAMKARLA